MPTYMFNTKISEIMSRSVLTAGGGETVFAAVKKMAALNVGAIIVSNKASDVLGIFTERDLMNKVVAKDKNVHTTTLNDVMTESPVVVSPEDSVSTVYLLFKDSTFRHLPVVDKNKKLVGILSVKDTTKAVSSILGKLIIE
ncbi:MAG: CBS domain-containing protein [Candidatus Omnitrophica bacterium]|nr:CBS domain-containing protein [Candidatus Omnitrophota bacterium]